MTDTAYFDSQEDTSDVGLPPDSLDREDPERELTSTLALFEGDEGGLELDQRKTLVVLLKKRFISNQSDPKEWKALMANPRVIRSRLNDLFMDLHLDTEREVAYKRQVSPEGGGRPFPTLLYDTAWGREDTILLVYLRTQARHEQASGAERVFVERDDMLEFIAQHRPERATDQTSDAKRASAAVEALTKAGLLMTTNIPDRFEVSAAIEVMLPMEKLHELLAWLKEQNNPTDPTLLAAPGAAETTDPDGNED
ncbi:DUF4194 domain-containing protein [Pedococcus bigeumensis]|uniref:DUF4194 domain-containing protein n=1 Tax=Pedococcus bigeumensis TaxID=433644 RepID=UPI002FED9007